jgi:putative tricarboxylic transport membrane protein
MVDFHQIAAGFLALLDPVVLAYMLGGYVLGVIFASIPGLTGTLAIALLLPLTYGLDVTTALVMCAAIFMAGQYGGSITAITINIPGAPCAVMTAYEGNRLMRKGQGPLALRRAAIASAIGGVFGAVLLMLVAPIVARLALFVQTPGKFALILFALIVVIISHHNALVKGTIATIVGLMLATIGIDVMTPVARETFGIGSLVEGIDMMSVIIGTFAIAEVLVQLTTRGDSGAAQISASGMTRRDFVPTWADFKDYGLIKWLKSCIIGFFVGVLPGAGGSAAAFLSYAEAKRSSKRASEFGNGSSEGICAAESANNAMCGGAYVPMLTFGIPGDGTTAVILGVLVINGLQPGPQLFASQFDLISPMMAALLVSAVLIPFTLVLFGRSYMRIISINRGLLFSAVTIVAIIGAYVSSYSVFQMWSALAIGILAFMMGRQGYPTVCLLLGFILGPDLEIYYRRAVGITEGSPSIFFTSIDSLVFLALTLMFVYFMVIRKPSQPDDVAPENIVEDALKS